MNLTKLVQTYILNQTIGSPIFISDIMHYIEQFADDQKMSQQIRKNVNVILMRMVKDGNYLKRFGTGIYYRDDIDQGEETGIDSIELIRRTYIEDKRGNVFGYLTGAAFLHKLGLIEKSPHKIIIATNAKRNGNIETTDMEFKLVNPSTTVTRENYRYLQILDLIKNDLINGDNVQYSFVLTHFMNKYQLKEAKLVALAVDFYSQKVVVKVAEFISNKVYLEEQKDEIIITLDTTKQKELYEND
ncbi:DUF6088 family protein [Carnobacterium viridans]|uniref:Transcriptional regulator, AbiEi antitoxin, Type IV TA system n=1 Tax=Carnobacterium viridans TaxID=174587 RepID=A0A1H0YBA4_9LACT|nr:DUF6088 family protein [Carnobacterium viridans]UDE95229.1 DUF6088 family protein [Carnobacterium viridans]SDQ12529.1 hypothetical protein SAMN04487752_0847 [Carnobacterium viridans]